MLPSLSTEASSSPWLTKNGLTYHHKLSQDLSGDLCLLPQAYGLQDVCQLGQRPAGARKQGQLQAPGGLELEHFRAHADTRTEAESPLPSIRTLAYRALCDPEWSVYVEGK